MTDSQIESELNVWRQLKFSNGPCFGLLKSAHSSLRSVRCVRRCPNPVLLGKKFACPASSCCERKLDPEHTGLLYSASDFIVENNMSGGPNERAQQLRCGPWLRSGCRRLACGSLTALASLPRIGPPPVS